MSNNATSNALDSPFVVALSSNVSHLSQQQNTPSTHESVFDHWTRSAIERVSDFHAQYVAPITKQQVDNFIVNSIGFSAYSSLTAAAKIADASSFTVRAEMSIGYKLFTAVANPFVAQFVESFTEVHLNNAKYIYYKSSCMISGTQCEKLAGLKNTLSPYYDENEQPPLIQDFTQFDAKGYLNEVSANLDGLKVSSLISGGIFSASASHVRDVIFDATGLTPHMQGYWSKNWGSYYFKEWIKGELKAEADIIKNNLQDKLGLNDVELVTKNTTEVLPSQPLDINDIITSNHQDVFAPISAPIPFLDTTHLLTPLQVATPVEVLI